jgi:hypothetical protein
MQYKQSDEIAGDKVRPSRSIAKRKLIEMDENTSEAHLGDSPRRGGSWSQDE